MPLINNLDYKAQSVLVLGVKRVGKSTLASRYIDLHPASLVLIYDWQGGEYSTRCGGRLAKTRSDLAALIDDGHRLICYDAERGEGDEVAGAGFEWWCEMCYDLSGQTAGEKLIVVDEIQRLIDPYEMPLPLENILTCGGRREMNTLLVGHAPNGLHTDARNEVTELFCFRSIDERALKYPKSFGLDPDEIKKLPDCVCWHVDMRTGAKKRLDLWGNKPTPKVNNSPE